MRSMVKPEAVTDMEFAPEPPVPPSPPRCPAKSKTTASPRPLRVTRGTESESSRLKR